MRIWTDERGAGTLPTVLGASFALVAFLTLAGLVLTQYGRGVARTAVDEAVRLGAVVGDVGSCRQAAAAVLDDLLGGPLGDRLEARCVVDGGLLIASVEGTLPALVPGIGESRVAARASAAFGDP